MAGENRSPRGDNAPDIAAPSRVGKASGLCTVRALADLPGPDRNNYCATSKPTVMLALIVVSPASIVENLYCFGLGSAIPL